jgi:hypothetical protein
MSAQKDLNISFGPSKFNIMASLFNEDSDGRIALWFQFVEDVPAKQVVINSCERLDRYAFDLNIKGRIVLGRTRDNRLRLGDKFEAFYSLSNKKGWMKIKEPTG